MCFYKCRGPCSTHLGSSTNSGYCKHYAEGERKTIVTTKNKLNLLLSQCATTLLASCYINVLLLPALPRLTYHTFHHAWSSFHSHCCQILYYRSTSYSFSRTVGRVQCKMFPHETRSRMALEREASGLFASRVWRNSPYA